MPPKRRTRTAREPSPSYDPSWLTDADKFPKAVSRFEEIMANSKIMDSSLQQSITSAVSSAVATAVASIQAKHESEILSLREMIEKSLLLRESPSSTPPPDPDATPKSFPAGDSLQKASTERWNQADLGYFDPHLDRAHGEGEVVSVGKDVYYRNVMLFVQRLQSLVIFKGAALVKANVATSLRGSALEWYTSELSNFDRDALNNDPGVKSWINTLFHRFKVPTSVALGLLTDETYSLEDARARRPPAQYVWAIMRHGIGCNIVDVANQLSFAYRGLAPELRVFVTPPTEATRAFDFIRALEEKQEVWHEMMTAPAAPPRYYNPARRPSPSSYRPPLPSQPEAFSRYQSQQRIPHTQLPWRGPERPSGFTQPTTTGAMQRQYSPQSFRQTFMPQRQHYPGNEQRYQQPSSLAGASRDTALRSSQNIQSLPRAPDSAANRPPTALYQPVPRQPYQSGQSQCGYQRSEEKGVYQVDNEAQEELEEDLPDGETYYTDEPYDELQVNFVGIESICDRCTSAFPSRSALHKHIRNGCIPVEAVAETGPSPSSARPILKSTAKLSAPGSGLAFSGWNYVTTSITFDPAALPSPADPDGSVCLDTGCGVTLVDRDWLTKKLPSQKISTMPVPLKVRGIGASKHESGHFALTTLYIPGTDEKGREVYASITCELNLVDRLKANMLVGNDVLCTEGFAVNLYNSSALIHSYGVRIDINARQHSEFLRHRALASAPTIIPPHSEALVTFQRIKLPDSRDFLFSPAPQHHLTLYSHLLDHNSTKILVRNEACRAIKIPLHHRLGYVTELPYESCFPTSADLDVASTPPTSSTIFHDRNGISIPPAGDIETELPNGIKIYGDREAVDAITRLVKDYPTIWESSGFVQVPPERWMKVHLKSGWETKVSSIKSRVYPLGIEAKCLVDETFDEMQRLGRLKYTTSHTPFSFPVFMVYKTNAKGERKGRAVVDIRKLNDLVVSDAYPLPLQSNIIASIQGCTNLAVLDAASFFYQWLLHPDHRYMFTVVTHRGQETFQVPIMGYINLVAYVQREIDNILRDVREWACAYVNDIVCGGKSLPDLLTKLRMLFDIFIRYNISIQPTKSYLNYPDVALLGQRVNSLGLSTSEEKLKAVRLLKYPETLGALEYYLGLTGYLRSYIHYYAQLASPLQALKTSLLKKAPESGQQRWAYASKTKLEPPTERELAAFDALQLALSQPTTLVHHNPDRPLWIDLDTSKEFGFDAVAFHTAEVGLHEAKWPSSTSMQPILFLSRLLTAAKKNYWPTELEIAGFVWVIKKLRHLVESSRASVIIQTDHSAILDIMQQSSITSTSSTMKMNVCLVRASQFLQQFRLVVRHKPGKEHIIPDALSRLASANRAGHNKVYSELDALFTYHTTLVEISPDLIKRILDGYLADDW